MSKNYEYVFVLWGDEFEEVPAAIFVAELREAGLRVKVVGLNSRRISGSHGLVLGPDLTLDQALPLAARAICLVIPYGSYGIKRLKNDPRLGEFFDQAHKNQARFVIGPLSGVDLVDLELFPPSAANKIVVYPDREDMVNFARELARSLLEM